MCESSLFRHLFTQHENICRKQRGTEETGRKVWRSQMFPVLLDRKHSHSLSAVTLKRSSHGLPFLLQNHKTSQLNAGDRTAPIWLFLCVHFPFITANSMNLVVFPRVNPQSVLKQEPIKESRPPGWQTPPHVPGRPSRTPAYRRPSSASLPVNTSLVFNVNIQLCTDFFLRTSCGSLTMIAEVCPPLVTTEIWKQHHSNTGAIVFSQLRWNWDTKRLFCQDTDNIPTVLWWQFGVSKQTNMDSFNCNPFFFCRGTATRRWHTCTRWSAEHKLAGSCRHRPWAMGTWNGERISISCGGWHFYCSALQFSRRGRAKWALSRWAGPRSLVGA